MYFSRANLTGAQGKDSILKGVHVTSWFCGPYATPTELEFWLSLKSVEVHIALLREELHAQDFLSTFQELNSIGKWMFLHWEFFQVYLHICFQLSVNKSFPKEKLPGKGNFNPHHSHQLMPELARVAVQSLERVWRSGVMNLKYSTKELQPLQPAPQLCWGSCLNVSMQMHKKGQNTRGAGDAHMPVRGVILLPSLANKWWDGNYSWCVGMKRYRLVRKDRQRNLLGASLRDPWSLTCKE